MSFTLATGAVAPDFDLPATDGRNYALRDFADARVLVVAFTCNHCPYVIGSEDRMIALVNRFGPRGMAFVAINCNETDNHPGDSFQRMVERAADKEFNFPYLRDESQEIARAYGAIRTPHFYAFDGTPDGVWRLAYTGRLDDNPRSPGKQTTHELADAIEALLAGRPVAVAVTNPIGCNVKWKGKPEKWMPPEACDLV